MVLERLFPDSLLERKEWSAFVLAITYSAIAIVIARLLFPANSGIVSIIFLSIFLLPYFESILKREERQEKKDKKRTFLHLLRDNTDAIKVYLFLFFGIYITYTMYSFCAHYFGFDTTQVFREQLSLESVRGGAVFSTQTFWSILFNNWWVLLACFLIALIAGDGAIFFIAWNASTWGTIFGYRAIEASTNMGWNPVWTLLIVLFMTLPHVIIEGTAYILAAIAGGVISDEIVEKSDEIRKFIIYFIIATTGYVTLLLALHFIVQGEHAVFFGIVAIIAALGIFHLMHTLFTNVRDAAVFRYNFYLFCTAIGLFIFGALVETLVLYNATPLRSVYLAARAG